MESAILGGGCFWCLEAVFEQLKGVDRVTSGYCGDTRETADYRSVCSGRTRHAEVVKVDFDSLSIDYRMLLEVFFNSHDPTTKNRQGNDVGPQYRSIIFAQNDEQLRVAQDVMAEAARWWEATIVTELVPAMPFYPAEDYHQAYFRGNGDQPYCAYVVAPKVSKFREYYGALLKPEFRSAV